MPCFCSIALFIAWTALLATFLHLASCQYIDESYCEEKFFGYGNPNITKGCYPEAYFVTWRAKKYEGYLAVDPTFWPYQAQTQFVLTNGLAIDFAAQKCQAKFTNLIYFKSGRHGPVDELNAWKSMCSDVCVQNDQMHFDAMCFSGCNCLELSTQRKNPTWTRDGDWCSQNTARLLCDIIGFCGVWGCSISDYMCPRHEYNMRTIPLKGYGSCLRIKGAAASRFSGGSTTILVSTIVVLIAVAIGDKIYARF